MITTAERRRRARVAVVQEVTRGTGVVPSAVLVRRGHSKHVIAALVDDGVLLRIRRRWVALPTADAQALASARSGIITTCVTEAKRLGLWVLDAAHQRDAGQQHVAARPHSSRIDVAEAVVHWGRPLVPRHPDALFDPIENVLALTACCQPFETALAIWESAINRGLIDLPTLTKLPLSQEARRILANVNPFAGSGLESFVLPRLRWLRVRIIPQAWILGHRVDFLIGERLILQIDGSTHVGPQRTEDIRHDAALLLRGYHVIRVGYEQMVNDWPAVQDVIARAVAQGLHRVS